ncbi:MAG: hypothetical protein LBK68_08120 [Candidatus Margulisbacteria bacterium]|jgi:hypothetical protein|nr:hypothetical protein [Candidatus Margulisiibacteriota bacterium]
MNDNNTPQNRNEVRKSILEAVSGHEDVITSFNGTKKTPKLTLDENIEPRTFGLGYLLWNFFGGLFFGFGLLIMAIVMAWVLSNYNEVRAVTNLFGKLIGILIALGK